MIEAEEGSTYFNLIPVIEKKVVEGVETDVVVDNLFTIEVASLSLTVENKTETPIVADVIVAPVDQVVILEAQTGVEAVEIVIEEVVPVAVVEETLAEGEGSFVDEIDDMMNAVNSAISN